MTQSSVIISQMGYYEISRQKMKKGMTAPKQNGQSLLW